MKYCKENASVTIGPENGQQIKRLKQVDNVYVHVSYVIVLERGPTAANKTSKLTMLYEAQLFYIYPQR
jgi:hypothetical protein